ncbi:MAG: hypothetical protein P4L51_10055 [Puia sp.]|nr:hypothetical protein [Puia sp.]
MADEMVKLVESPKGGRPLWTIVGGGAIKEYVDQVNQTTRSVVDTMLSYMGV